MLKLGQVDRVEIKGFRSIRHAKVELRALNVLIGPNGAGKSNFIAFFKFMNRLVLKELQLYTSQQGGASRLLHFGQKYTSAIEVYLHFKPNGYRCRLIPTTSDELVFEDEQWEFHADEVGYGGGFKYGELAVPGAKESGLPDRPNTRSASGHIVRYLLDWKVYHFHDTSESAPVKKTNNLNDSSFLRPDGGNLAAFLNAIKETESYSRIVDTIRRVAPFFHDFILEPERNNPSSIRLRWRHKGDEGYFDANDLSDGTLRFICLATLLLQPNLPTTVLLDEPELGLHPYALQLLAGMIQSAAAATQLIISTQSVTLANQFSWEDVVVVDREQNASVFRRLNSSEITNWINEFALGELWEKNLIGGMPK